MVRKVSKPVIMPIASTNTKGMKEYNLFIGEWTQADTNHMCNPRPKKEEKLEKQKLEAKENYNKKKWA
jgi:hypothetical protein